MIIVEALQLYCQHLHIFICLMILKAGHSTFTLKCKGFGLSLNVHVDHVMVYNCSLSVGALIQYVSSLIFECHLTIQAHIYNQASSLGHPQLLASSHL